MTTLSSLRHLVKRFVQGLTKVLDEFCICTRCRDERMFEAARKKHGGRK